MPGKRGRKCRPITGTMKMEIHRLRRGGHHPREIAKRVGRTEGAIRVILSRDKIERGIEHKPLPHGNTKYTKDHIAEWRRLKELGWTNKMIHKAGGPHPAFISRKMAEDARGELL